MAVMGVWVEISRQDARRMVRRWAIGSVREYLWALVERGEPVWVSGKRQVRKVGNRYERR